ncbi:MAG: class I SAM-dependent methyltransferase [Desulfobacterales bacterium]
MLQEKAEKLSKRGFFTGGPVADFETIGRLQFITLLKEGLYPSSKVLDIGCGCLRGGYWIIHFLKCAHYFGIEPNREMLDAGIQEILGSDLVEEKQPRFDYNTAFDFSAFGEKFDFFVARSIWTHTSKQQIQNMLDLYIKTKRDRSVFLTSYLRAGLFRNRDYKGDRWIGKSHESTIPGLVYHSFKWITHECEKRGLRVKELKEDIWNRQVWLRITAQ